MWTVNGSNIEVVKDPTEVAEFADAIVMSRIEANPEPNLGTITGESPKLLYLMWSGKADRFKGVTTCNVDDYCVPDGRGGYKMIVPTHPSSFKRNMRENLLDAVPHIRSYFPGIENYRHPGRYDKKIQAMGGLLLSLNGLGENGHVFGFNEPDDCSRDSVTRLVRVSDSTRNVNRSLNQRSIPEYAITTGIATGMAFKEVITLAFGVRKAAAVRRAIYDEAPEGASVILPNPSVVLREHPNHTWIIDEAAASQL